MCPFDSSYSPVVDGDPGQYVLSIPIRTDKILHGIVLRGERTSHFFADFDEKLLMQISHLIIQLLNNALMVDSSYQRLDSALIAQERISKLCEVVKTLTGTLDLEDLTPNIMTKACELLKAGRCSLFMVLVIFLFRIYKEFESTVMIQSMHVLFVTTPQQVGLL